MKYTYTANDPKMLTGSMREAIDSPEFWKSNGSTVALGKGVLLDISKAPHILIAGTTGSGKSVMLHNIIASLLLKNDPETAQFLIVDPKMVEFRYFYQGHPCVQQIITDPADALEALENASSEMMRRYEIMSLQGLRFWNGCKLYIVIDEVADLIDTCGKRVEKQIANIARLGRGAGVHLIVATQHPTAQVLSRQITANLDTRIALRVDDSTASRLIIREAGAEKLRNKGDAIMRNADGTRFFHGAFITDAELEAFAKSYEMQCEPEACDSLYTRHKRTFTAEQPEERQRQPRRSFLEQWEKLFRI